MKIICRNCGKLKEHEAKGMCKKCYDKKYRLENKEKRNVYKKKYRLENPEKRRICDKKYKLKNKERIEIKAKEYRLKRRGYGTPKKGIVDKIITENILKYGIIICEKCKKQCSDSFHIDHITPVSKGGPNTYGNLQILCQYCNLKKHIKTIDYRQDVENNQMFLKT